MVMAPRLRRFALTVHITSTVGWLGAIAGFLALAVAGLVSSDVQLVRSSYLAMELIGWYVLVPLSIGSLIKRTRNVARYDLGLVQALLGFR